VPCLPAVAADVLTARSLNRASLARQLLLERSTSVDPLTAVERLVGLQAQNPLDPYLALWSRLADFDPGVVGGAMEDRRLVRIVVMRGTIHLVTADDAVALPPVVQPVLDMEIARHPEFSPHLRDLDLAPLLAFTRSVLAEQPSTMTRLRAAIADRFPDVHPGAVAYATRCHVPLVQVPPRGVWGKKGQVTLAPVETWLDRPLGTTTAPDGAVLRYLAVFGPATVADVAAWTRLTAMREVLDRLAPRLRTFADERGRTLYDVPDGLLPDPDVDAPVRFLPEYDNALLSYADRTRFAPDDDRRFRGAAEGAFKGSVLVDGRVRAIWAPDRAAPKGRPTVVVTHHLLTAAQAADVEAEARRMAVFWLGATSEDAAEVRFVPLPAA
jgi:Winged helix DNA-binding domain